MFRNFIANLFGVLALGGLVIAGVASQPTALTSAASTASATDQTTSKGIVDCGTLTGFSPYCWPRNQSVPLLAKGFMPGSNRGTYCVIPANFQATAINVAAKLIGHKSGKFYRIKSGAHKQLCRPMPAHGCPKINLRMRSGDLDTNLGLYPTCGTSLKLPTESRPFFKLCATNPASSAWELDLSHGNKLSMAVKAKPGQRVCVVRSFSKHQIQNLRVWWDDGTFTIKSGQILTGAYYWRLGG